MKPKILAISGSLRNARWGRGVEMLLGKIKSIPNRESLLEFTEQEGQIHLEHFLQAGRAKGLPFDELYKDLRKIAGNKGLCNSEIGMAAALWGTHYQGCDIDYLPLSDYFTPDGLSKNLEQMKQRVLSADGLLFCSPVYFGDRSSLVNDFVEFVRRDPELRSGLAGKPMNGVTVGAKRNGGQETTLIYQLMDMTSLGMLGLGNNSDTTAQYGGTIHAGDIGTASRDEYGIDTAVGAGKRIADVAKLIQKANVDLMKGPLKVMFWILQDHEDGTATGWVNTLLEAAGDRVQATIFNLIDGDVARCMACDICPSSVGNDAVYRCIIKKKNDNLAVLHEKFLDQDLIVPVVFSSRDRTRLRSVYQRFIERTRYLRRGDYLFSDVMIMPLILEEVGAHENIHIRLLTSLIRHHTVMMHANIGYIHNGNVINREEVLSNWQFVLNQAVRLTVGRLMVNKIDGLHYQPVGYILSSTKDKELSVKERRQCLQLDREKRRKDNAIKRLKPV